MPAPTITANPCSVTQALAYWHFQLLRSLNKKFAALQRLALLLEQLGDLSSLLPNISQLVPVINLNLDLYTQLQVSCPFLNLPPFSDGSLAQLQSQLNEAYARLARQILNHPWLRMNQLQGLLNDFQNKLNFPWGSDYLTCLNSVCASIEAAGGIMSGISQVNIGKELDLFTKNFVNNGAQVLTEPMQVKRDEALQTYNQVLDLRTDTVQDFRSLSTSGAVNPQGPPLQAGQAVVPNFQFQANGTLRSTTP